MTPPRRWRSLAVIALAAAVAYAPSFAVPFQYDDYARIGQNRALQDGQLFEALVWFGNSRVVPSLTLAANFWAGGIDPIGYHAVNFAVHLLTAFGVVALALALCETPRLRAAWPPPRASRMAVVAGLVFACHPLQAQAVTYVIQRYASMAALFYVWAVVAFLHARLQQVGSAAGRSSPYFVASAVLGICAVLSKENAVSLPAALLLAEWVGFGWPHHRRVLLIGAGLALLAVAVPLVWKLMMLLPDASDDQQHTLLSRVADALAGPPATPDGALPTFGEYLLTEATVVPRYLLLIVRPWGLNVDHDVPLVRTVTPAVAGGLVVLAALAIAAVTQVRRRPLAAFAILWLFVALSVESSVIPIVDPMVEHRMYLPMVGVAIGIGALFATAAERVPRLAWSAGGAAIVGLIALTFARNLVWQSPLTLWLDATEKSPDKARPQLNLGVAYHQLEQLDDAIPHYCRALQLAPDDRLAHDNLEIALEALGIGASVKDARPDGTTVLEMKSPETFCQEDRASARP